MSDFHTSPIGSPVSNPLLMIPLETRNKVMARCWLEMGFALVITALVSIAGAASGFYLKLMASGAGMLIAILTMIVLLVMTIVISAGTSEGNGRLAKMKPSTARLCLYIYAALMLIAILTMIVLLVMTIVISAGTSEGNGRLAKMKPSTARLCLYIYAALMGFSLTSVFYAYDIKTIGIAFGVRGNGRLAKMKPSTARLCLYIYAALMGFSLTSVFYAYDIKTIGIAFGVSALYFFALAIYGFFCKKDLTSLGPIFLVMLLVLLISEIVIFVFFPNPKLPRHAVGLVDL